MKRFLIPTLHFVWITLILLIVVFWSLARLSKSYSPETPTFHTDHDKILGNNVSVVHPKSGEVHAEKSILIQNGKILSIVDSDKISIEDSFHVIDGTDKYVMHGLTDMHTHIFDRTDLMMYLSYGVTHVRNMMGFDSHLRWREEVHSGQLEGSRMVTASPTLNSSESSGPFHIGVDNEEEAFEAVDRSIERGYDFIKVYDGLAPQVFVSISKRAQHHNVTMAGHPIHSITAKSNIKWKLASVEHVEEIFQGFLNYKFDTAEVYQVSKLLRESNTPVVATLSAYKHLYKTVVEKDDFLKTLPTQMLNPVLRYIGESSLEGWKDPTESGRDWTIKKWEFMEEITRILEKEEVPLLLGTDTGPNLTIPGWSIHREIASLQKVGLSVPSILASGTSRASDLLNHPTFPGSIKEGVASNMLLVSENPLDNPAILENPNMLILGESVYQSDDLQEMRSFAIEHRTPWYITIGMMIDHFWNEGL